MKCIDFDAHFADYLADWTRKNAQKYRTYDDMEDAVPEVYEAFLSTPAPWLDGAMPGAYFEEYQDADELIRWMCEYQMADVPVPDMLLNRISALGKASESGLYKIAADDQLAEDTRMLAVTLLREIESTLPLEMYVSWQVARKEDDDLADSALESLEEMGEAAVPAMLCAVDDANEPGLEALCSVLCRYPGNERVLSLLLSLFTAKKEHMAVLAGYLGQLGDERALPVLMTAALDESTGYLDFIEVRSAIEELGGDAPKRTFDASDPAYEALKKLQ